MNTPIAPLQWPYPAIDEAWQAGDRSFFETTLDVYENQLNCLPPVAQLGSHFLVGEPYTHTGEGARIVALYAAFYQLGNRVFCRMETLREFALRQSVPAIYAQFGL